MPLDFSKPGGPQHEPIEADTLSRMCTGFQPSSATFLIACAANFGVAMLTKISAPDALSATICEVDGRVGRSRRASRRRSSSSCRRARPSGPSARPCRSRRSGTARRSCRPAGAAGCIWRRCALRSGSSAGSPWSRGNSSGRPIWWRRSRRTAAAPSWYSCISGSPSWARCRAAEKISSTSSLSTSLRACSTVFGGE